VLMCQVGQHVSANMPSESTC